MGTQAIDTWNERETCRYLLRASASVWGWWWSISAAYRHWGWDLGTLLRARTKATKHGVAPHLVPKTEEGADAMICRQSHVDCLLGLQRADLRALHAQRKNCDQCHLLKPSKGKYEASYSPETARDFDDGSVSPPRQCEATYCYSNSVDYWGAGSLSASHTLRTHPTSRLRIFTSSVHWRMRWAERSSGTTMRLGRRCMSGCAPVQKNSFPAESTHLSSACLSALN